MARATASVGRCKLSTDPNPHLGPDKWKASSPHHHCLGPGPSGPSPWSCVAPVSWDCQHAEQQRKKESKENKERQKDKDNDKERKDKGRRTLILPSGGDKEDDEIEAFSLVGRRGIVDTLKIEGVEDGQLNDAHWADMLSDQAKQGKLKALAEANNVSSAGSKKELLDRMIAHLLSSEQAHFPFLPSCVY